MKYILLLISVSFYALSARGQEKPKHEDTEFYTPVPLVVTPGASVMSAPSDAIILFDGTNLDQWVNTNDKSPAKWIVENGLLTVAESTGNIETKQSFNNYQLHIEFKVPQNVTGSGQERGNSGVFLASTGKGNAGYELQILDSYHNETYTNGQGGSVYKQSVPLANANKKPGEWQVYGIVCTAPVFSATGSLTSPARVTVLFNGVLVQNNFELKGPILNVGKPCYPATHRPCPIKLQAHGDKSEAVSFKNIWIREIKTL
jgi:hypothetical protein